VSRGAEHTQFDHTSLLKYMTEKWSLGPLGRRTAAASSIGAAIRESQPRTDTIPFIRVPYTQLMPDHPEWEQKDNDSKHHQGLQAFAEHLGEQVDGIGKFLQQGAPVAKRVANIADQIKAGALQGRFDAARVAGGKL
jgi:phospholipase C